MSCWDWAVAAHARPGVDRALMEIQDVHGQCVAYLLWAAWAAAEGRPLDEILLRQGAALAEHWEAAATGPLRSARRRLKAPAPPVDDGARAALREEVRKAEFAAERLLMETLEALAPASEGSPLDPAGALVSASRVYCRPASEEALRELAGLL